MRKKSKYDGKPESERRQWPRLQASSVPFLKGVILGQGTEVQVIDISRGGLLLETEVRLPPQMKIHLKLITSDGVIKMVGSVLRSSISSLTGVPKYRSAVIFDHPFLMLDDLSEESLVTPEECREANSAAINGEGLANLTFVTKLPGSSLRSFFKPE